MKLLKNGMGMRIDFLCFLLTKLEVEHTSLVDRQAFKLTLDRDKGLWANGNEGGKARRLLGHKL